MIASTSITDTLAVCNDRIYCDIVPSNLDPLNSFGRELPRTELTQWYNRISPISQQKIYAYILEENALSVRVCVLLLYVSAPFNSVARPQNRLYVAIISVDEDFSDVLVARATGRKTIQSAYDCRHKWRRNEFYAQNS